MKFIMIPAMTLAFTASTAQAQDMEGVPSHTGDEMPMPPEPDAPVGPPIADEDSVPVPPTPVDDPLDPTEVTPMPAPPDDTAPEMPMDLPPVDDDDADKTDPLDPSAMEADPIGSE